jgi:hypothetical protein
VNLCKILKEATGKAFKSHQFWTDKTDYLEWIKVKQKVNKLDTHIAHKTVVWVLLTRANIITLIV